MVHRLEVSMRTVYKVWIGGIYNQFNNKQAAKEHAKEWRDMGYDDVIIETVKEKE